MAKSKMAEQIQEVNNGLAQLGRLQANIERVNRRILGSAVQAQRVNQVATRRGNVTVSLGGSGGGSGGGGKTLIILGKMASTLEKIEKNGNLYMSTRTGAAG